MVITKRPVLTLHQVSLGPYSRAKVTNWTLVDFSRLQVASFDAPIGGAHGILRGFTGPRTQRTTNRA